MERQSYVAQVMECYHEQHVDASHAAKIMENPYCYVTVKLKKDLGLQLQEPNAAAGGGALGDAAQLVSTVSPGPEPPVVQPVDKSEDSSELWPLQRAMEKIREAEHEAAAESGVQFTGCLALARRIKDAVQIEVNKGMVCDLTSCNLYIEEDDLGFESKKLKMVMRGEGHTNLQYHGRVVERHVAVSQARCYVFYLGEGGAPGVGPMLYLSGLWSANASSSVWCAAWNIQRLPDKVPQKPQKQKKAESKDPPQLVCTHRIEMRQIKVTVDAKEYVYQVPWLVNLPVPDGEAGEIMMKQAADGHLYREKVDFDDEILKAKDERVKKVAENNFVNS